MFRTNAPISREETKGENIDVPRELLLASGEADKSILIWRAGSDGRYETVLYLPTYSLASNNYQRSVFFFDMICLGS